MLLLNCVNSSRPTLSYEISAGVLYLITDTVVKSSGLQLSQLKIMFFDTLACIVDPY